ncbi:MAG: hypothetical protein U0325_22760 [Polyangiales bacterium]
MFERLKQWLRGGGPAPTPAAEPEAGFTQEIITPGFADDELRRAQHAYWRSNPTEKRSLLARVDALGPQDALRALHLLLIGVTAALRAVSADDAFFADDDGLAPDDVALCRKLVARLTADAGALRPRRATVTQAGGTLRGELINASLSHLGALEVLRADRDGQPMVEFVPFSAIRSVELGAPETFREAVLRLEGAPDFPAPVRVPLLYGVSWSSREELDRDGSMTRFVAHVPAVLGEHTLGLGIGHQDFMLSGDAALFGLGSVRAITFDG